MTALKEYQRLETFGIWHASPTAQRRDVGVALGEATLTISDATGTALSHWSLPAVRRTNPGEVPACFVPGPDMGEMLEIEDEVMISAIERVRRAIERRRPQPQRLRRLTVVGLLVLVAMLVGFWLPGALVRQAVAVVPAATRIELGEALLDDIRRSAGAPCEGVLGRRALDRLRARLIPDRSGRIVVLAEGISTAQHLPGGLILLNRRLVEDHEDPALAAGHVLAQDEAARAEDPVQRLLEDAGVWPVLKLLATGRMAENVIEDHAAHLMQAAEPHPADSALIDRAARAEVPLTPYARDIDPEGRSTATLLAQDPVAPGEGRQILPDGDWVSLQGICAD